MPNAPKTFRSTERRKEREELRGSSVERGYDARWNRISKMYRAQHPVCEHCNDAASDDVDHIVPFKGINDPLRTDMNNLQALCRSCHVRKTARQSR